MSLKMTIKEYEDWNSPYKDNEVKPKSKNDSLVIIGLIMFVILVSNIITYQVVSGKVNKEIANFKTKHINYTNNLISEKVLASQDFMLNQNHELVKRMDRIENKFDIFQYQIDNVYNEIVRPSITIKK